MSQDTIGAPPRRLVVVPVHRTRSGVSLFSAAGGSQTAHSLDEQGRGLGGGADLDGDGAVRSGELKFYLEDEVPRAAMNDDREQTPAVFTDDENQVLVRLP